MSFLMSTLFPIIVYSIIIIILTNLEVSYVELDRKQIFDPNKHRSSPRARAFCCSNDWYLVHLIPGRRARARRHIQVVGE